MLKLRKLYMSIVLKYGKAVSKRKLFSEFEINKTQFQNTKNYIISYLTIYNSLWIILVVACARGCARMRRISSREMTDSGYVLKSELKRRISNVAKILEVWRLKLLRSTASVSKITVRSFECGFLWFQDLVRWSIVVMWWKNTNSKHR